MNEYKSILRDGLSWAQVYVYDYGTRTIVDDMLLSHYTN